MASLGDKVVVSIHDLVAFLPPTPNLHQLDSHLRQLALYLWVFKAKKLSPPLTTTSSSSSSSLSIRLTIPFVHPYRSLSLLSLFSSSVYTDRCDDWSYFAVPKPM